MNINRAKTTRILGLLAALIAMLSLSVVIHAQETRGTVRGIVTDPNGHTVPNASVQVIDPARGAKVTLSTNNDGLFQATYLTPGEYQVIVQAPGFKKMIRDKVVLHIAESLQIDITLEVGGASESVNVTVELPPLNTENASLGQVVDAQRIAELPLVHGDPYTLIGMSAGTSYTGDPRLDRPFEPTHIVGFAINGVRGNRMDLTIDGVASTATANQNEVIASYVPPSDIVQEFKVQTATFDAQFGNTEGSVTSISIKSGTNSFHGSAYLFQEPGSWAANDTFGKARGQARPDTYSNRIGGYISGPVRIPWLYNGKDKSFFLFGFEAIRDSRPRFDVSNVWVPTAALASGDFSAYLCPSSFTPTQCSNAGLTNIYDPLTRTNGGSGTTYTGTQFADPTRATAANPLGLNIIPLNRLNDVAKAILPYFGNPKNPGLVGNINDSTLAEKTKPYNNWSFRADQQLSQNNHLFVRGSWYDRSSLYNRYTDSAYTGVNFIFASRGGVIDDVHTFNSTTFLNVKYGYNRFIRASGAQDDAVGFDLTKLWGSTAGATFNNIAGTNRRFPRFNFPTNGTLGNGLTNEYRPVDSHNAVAVLSKNIGSHSMKFGGELRIYREDDSFQSNDQTGQFTFNNTYTRASTNTGTGPQEVNGLQAFASFLLGLPTTADITRRADYSEYSKTWGFFVQDDFKLARNLSINVGLRYEREEGMVERQNKSVSGFDFGFVQPSQTQIRANFTSGDTDINGVAINPATFNVLGGLMFAGKDTGAKLYSTPQSTFLPRFGVAYRLNDKTVLRGGVGLFAGFLGERRGDVIQSGFTRTTALATTTLANGAVIPQSISLFPTAISVLEPVGNAAGKTTGLGGSVSFFNQNPKSGKQLRWQFGIQRQLPFGLVLEAVYVGNKGYDLEIIKDLNALPSQYLVDEQIPPASCPAGTTDPLCVRNAALGLGLPNPFRNVPGFEGTSFFTGTTISRSQLLRPFPQFTSVLTSNNDGRSWYHSGQFGLQKRFSGGNTVQFSYTWSKWLQATEYLNAGDALPTRMIADQDVPHRFSLSAIYALPFGKGKLMDGKNPIVNRIIGGWQLQGVYQFQVGFPIAFGSYSLTGGTTSGDIYYLGGKVGLPYAQQSTNQWFNTAVFSQTAPLTGHLRTAPFRFTDARRDNINNVDLSLLKNTQITESMKVQIRLEAINAFNHPYYPAPSTTLGGAFGTIGLATANQANYPRRMQIGFKFLF